jgi:hypothetical protein
MFMGGDLRGDLGGWGWGGGWGLEDDFFLGGPGGLWCDLWGVILGVICGVQ